MSGALVRADVTTLSAEQSRVAALSFRDVTVFGFVLAALARSFSSLLCLARAMSSDDFNTFRGLMALTTSWAEATAAFVVGCLCMEVIKLQWVIQTL